MTSRSDGPQADTGAPAIMARPVQLGLIEGTDKAVGPLVQSLIRGDNADLIRAVAPLYLTGSVLDVTYGRGMWWRRFTPEPFAFHDIAIDGVDFRALPEADDSWDTVCFDPPYLPQGGISSKSAKSVHFRRQFGNQESRTQAELDALLVAGLAECGRVARTWVLAKCTDYTNAKALHLGHIQMMRHAEAVGLRLHDLLVHDSRPGPGGGQIKVQIRARRSHSYLLVFTKGR